jgi:4-hydroxy-tetrahydrodipicolinate reductase
MNIAIIGYGKMGRLIEKIALEKNFRVTCIVDPFFKESQSFSFAPILSSISDSDRLKKADIAFEFTHPDTAFSNIKDLANIKVPAIVGTTGWYEKLPEVKEIVEANKSSLLYSSNFSLGVNIFYRIAEYAAALIDNFPEYDTGGFEVHHNKKADSPSGTAQSLAEKVLQQMKRKEKVVWETLNRPPEKEELHFPSLRVGSVPGIHALIFDSPDDTIEIRHTNRSRTGLVQGALTAGEWLLQKERHGVFTMEDVLRS